MATILTSGDIAIIGFNFDNPDEFAFVPLVDLETGTEIKFTDNGWFAAGGFRANEGTFTWTATENIPAGTVISPAVSSVAFSASGDQILAYQGEDANPTFIYALNSEGNPGVWQADATSSNTSALPTGLVNGETALALDEIDNAIYTGITSGTQAELLAAISDPSNWTGSNSDRQQLPNDAFTVDNGNSSGAVLTETFDDATQFTTSTPFFSDAGVSSGFDFFGISDGAGGGDFGGDPQPNGIKAYTGFEGSFLTGQDLDGEGATLPITVTWSGLDITGLSNLEFSGDFAEFFDDPGDIDDADFIRLSYQIDGGGFQNLLWFSGADFTSNSGPFNGFFREDTDFDGVGDGATLGNAAQAFTAAIAGTGSTLDLQLSVSLDAGDEDFGVDNFVVAEASGTTTNLSIVPTDANQAEGDAGTTPFTFTVNRSGNTTGETSVDFAVSSTAADADDFGGALPSGTVNFAADETSQVVTIDVTGDTEAELDESFTVTLSNASGDANITDATADGTIQNDDGVAITSISAIQGNGASSPIEGQQVTIEAVVVGDFQDGSAGTDGDLNGFFVQEQDVDADADATTSEGLFIFDGSSPAVDVNVGDVVQITGTVTEFEGLTELTNVSVSVEGTDTLPTAATVNFPVTTVDDLEAYEGMQITIPETLFVTEYFNLDRFGEVVLSADGDSNAPGTDGRLDQFTQFNAPDAAGFAAHQEAIEKRRIVLDDGQTVQNPDPIIHGRGGNPLSANNPLRGGDTVTDLTGVLSFGFGDYRIQPVDPVDFQATNPRPETPDPVGGNLKVVSFNVLNYFTTLDDGISFNDNPLTEAGLEPRGADDLTEFGVEPATAEFDRQTQKLVTTLVELDADVLGLVELENSSDDVALANLVAELNAALAGTGTTYAFISTPGLVGTDAITVGMIYKTNAVTPVGDVAILDDPSFTDPNGTGLQRNRPAIAQTFEDANGETFTAVVNHFKSKGDSGLEGGPLSNPDVDQGDGQGFWNDTRTKAAQALADWLATDPTGSGDSDFLILGDLNAYAQEDPLTTLEAAGYSNLAELFEGDSAYSFVFDGQQGTLDYGLASSSLLPQVTGTTEWHINADEPDAFDYNLDFGRNPALFDGTTPFRNSDHDPLIVGLELASDNTSTDLEIAIYDADSDTVITTLEGDDEILASDLFGRNVTIAAFVPDDSVFANVESMFLELNDGQVTQTENVEPYALFGNNGNNYRGGGVGLLPQGDNTIEFDLYAQNRLRGDLLGTVTRNFTIIDDISGSLGIDVALFDADTDQLLTPLEEGDEILASTLAGKNVTIAAFVPDDSLLFGQVESMFLDLNDGQVTQTENVEPYALFGNNGNNYRGGGVGLLPQGDNTIEFDLYSRNNLNGDLLGTVARNFTIVDDLGV
ncbi:MAG: ExeM/NucH family extracellular endonuclease [Cyanobacteria bacterium J06642_9]